MIRKEIVKQLKHTIMKLTSYYFNELNEEQQNRVMDNFCENGFSADYLNGKYSRAIVKAQVVVDQDFNLYDIKVFDPYNHVKDAECLPVYITPSGWSNWLYEYTDPAGHDVDEILEDYDGEVQED